MNNYLQIIVANEERMMRVTRNRLRNEIDPFASEER
jgi:hypothetical protein